uniref:DNA repair and recombination protein RAD54B n=1 Tax=Lygus hesperus TaxID=30085 RepID=A0A0A9W9U2_LYGHE
MYRKHATLLRQVHNCILVADEGHRLKNINGNKTVMALQLSAIRRRILLTGTPAQNNLNEFYAMMNFILPGVLNDPITFRQTFENPIACSKHFDATPVERAVGEVCSKQLDRVVAPHILRRTCDIISHLLPSKYDHIILLTCTEFQTTIYRAALAAKKELQR